MSGLSADRRGAPPESSPPAPGGIPPDRAAATGTGHAGAFARLRPALFRAAACLVVAIAALLALPGGASAQDNSVRPSWALTPSGLSDGDKFRLIFVTSTEHNATSSDIGDYNTFVQNSAAAGHSAIRSYSSQFRVVGSTAAVDARDNTGTTGTGVPIYWLDGGKVADDYADFYDGSWSNEGNAKNEAGTGINPSRVWTGSNHNGTAKTGSRLGNGTVAYGQLADPSDGPLSSVSSRNRTSLNPFYALSPVFTVKAGPSITDVSVTSRPADGTDTFKRGERVEITFTFDEAVEVQNAGTAGADVYINVSVGNAGVFNQQTNFSRQDHPRKLVFAFTVTVSHVDGNGFCIGGGCGADNIKLRNSGAVVATADDVAAKRNYGRVQTSWKLAGGSEGLTGGVCDRHPAVRDAIVAKVSAASTCADVTDSHLVDNVGSLDLSGEGIGALRKEDFEGLTSLHTLDLSGNALDHLPADLFEPLDFSLRTLKLNGNPLGALPAGLFDGLTGIQELDLADTGLTELPAGLFADLDSLQELRLVENRLRAFPAAALADVAGTLRELFMRDNDILSIAAGALDGMTRLRKLELQDNALASLPAGLFDDATELRELKLNDNALASLPDDLLRPLTKLEEVRLQGNPGFDDFAPAVEAIPAQSVERGARVDLEAVLGASPWGDNVTWSWTQTDSSGTTVTLNDANTATPSFDAPTVSDETTFTFEAKATGRGTSGANASEGAGTAQVTVPGRPSIVDVSVTTRPADGTNTFKRRDRIEITATFSEPVQLNNLSSVRRANINISIDAGHPLPTFHRQDHPNRLIFRHVVAGGDSGRLGTGNTSVTGNPGNISLGNLVSLTAVSDGANARRDFEGGQTAWRVDGGTVAPTGGVCDRQHKVRDAIVAAVSAASTCADVTAAHLAGIASLDLSGESIDSLRKADFAGLAGLTELDLSGNALDYLPGDLFEHVAALTDLTLQGNDIAALPANVFDGLTALRRLDLRGNALTGLPAGVFAALTDLRGLRLSNNALASLPDNVFAPLTKLENGALWITNNPGFADFVPRITVAVPAQTVRSGVRVDLEAVEGANPWGSNLVWSWTRTDTGSVTVTLEDDDTRSAHFVAPGVNAQTELAFEVTATGRGTAGVSSPSKATEDAAVTVLTAEQNATGTPTISGVPQVGNALTADTSGIADENDLPATLTYQWFRVDTGGTETPVGANSSSYTVSSSDVGFAIRVDVSFIDGAGNPEGPLASDAVPAVAAAGTCPAGSDWRATLTMGYTSLEPGFAHTQYFGFDSSSDFGALDPATIPYATGYPVTDIFRNLTTSLDGNTTLGDALTFTVTGGDLPDGTVLNLGATALTVGTDSQTTIAGQEQWNLKDLGLSPTWVSGQELTVCANLAPVLESAKADGTSLVLTYTEDLDTGSEPAPGAYSVTVDGGAGPAVTNVSVSGDTVTLTLAAAVTAGPAVTLTYSPGSNPVQDESGLDAPGFSNRTVAVNNDAVGEPTIEGTPQVGEMLTANVSAIGDTDGLPARFDYRWVRVAPGGAETDIGTNMSRYSPTYADVGSTIRVEVSFIDGAGYPEGPLASTATAAVPPTTTSGTCPADSDWRAALTLGYSSDTFSGQHIQLFGFNPGSNRGALDPATITYGSTDYTVTQILRNLTTSANATLDSLSFAVSGGELPDGTVLNLGGTTFTVGTDSRVGAGQEQWNLRTLGISLDWVADQELTVCANLPPGLESATVEGTSLVLTYTEDLDTRSVPLPGAYSVTVNGTAAPPSSVSVSGSKVTLTLADPVTAGQSVAVEYTPGSNPVQDGSGLDALPLTGEEVANKTPPIPASAEVPATGNKLTLTFNAALDIGPGKLPPASAFTVTADGDEVTVQSVGEGTGPDNFILNLSSTIKQGQTVTVDYAVPTTNPIEDTAGNDALAFDDFAVTNNSTLEGTPPEPASAEVTSTALTLTLTFNEDLDIAAVPPASAFTVKADGVEVAVQDVLYSLLDTLALRLSATIGARQIVTVSYAVPTTGTVIADVAGNDAVAFEDFPVTNNSTVANTTPPVPASAEVPASGASLTLTFNEDLDNGPGKLPPASAFTVKANGADVPVQSVTAGSGADSFILNLSSTIKQGQTVTVDYAVPTTNPIEDTAGNDALAFDDFAVTNNSTLEGTPPEPASAEVTSTALTLTLTFNEDLDIAAVPPASAFTVKADGVEVAVQDVLYSLLDTLALRLSATIGARQIVTVSYAVPTTGTVIEDLAGNEALAFEDFPVTNNSNVANTTPPVPASAEVPASGASLTLTFNEDLDNGSDKLPPASAFTVTASGDDVPVQSVTAGSGADSFVLDLGADAIKEKQCHTVTVDYEVPTTNPIQDTDGNPAVAFTGFEVTNNSTVVCPNDHSPVFPPPDPRMLTVAENVPLGTDIGVPVTATDADGDTLTYSVDTASFYSGYFQINSETGQLQTNEEGGVFNHEERIHVYGIIVVADDGRGRTAQITVAVSVTDVAEPPDAPLEVTVTGSGTTSLQVTWTAPPNLGRPAIEDYDVQYREAGETQWMDGPQDVIGTSATIMPVDAGKSYEVQVRATNDEGDGPWAAWGADNSPATGKPTIGGTPQVGQTLTADVSDIMDTDGLPSSFTYVWRSVDSSNNERLVGANSNTYSPESTDVDRTIKVEVSFTDGASNAETVTSDAVGPVVAAEPQDCVLGSDVWCATLTVQDLAGPSGHGCANSQSGKACSNPSHLTEDEFRHDGTDYDVTSISVATNGDLKLWLAPDPTAPTRTLVLVVDGERFALAHSGGSTSGSRTGRQWSGTGLSWSTGATVELRLVEGFQPLAPAAPRVAKVSGNPTSLKVTWSAPDNAGRPPITHYDLRYRETGTGTSGWQDRPQDQTATNATNATIAGLTTDTPYDVQVRASNADGDGPWSPSGQGTPGVETAQNGDVQLIVLDDDEKEVVSTTGGSGRLEVFYGGDWGTVCSDRFDRPFVDYSAHHPDPANKKKVANIAATLACKLSGAGSEGAMVTRPEDMTPLPDEDENDPDFQPVPIWLDDVRCAEGSTHWRGEGTEPPTALHHCYNAGVGLHNCDHTEDVYLQCTGSPPPESATQEAAAPLTASFEDLPDAHDGATAFTFRLSLSDDIANTDDDVRDSAFEVTGGSVTDVGRVGGRSDLWEITVTPDGTGNIGIVLLAARACGTAGALCTGDGRALTTALLVTVPASPQQAGALTAVFADMPAEHGGATGFTFELRFSESFPIGFLTMRDHAFTVTNGRVTRARRLDNPHHENQGMQPNREWEITVAPDTGAGDVTIALPETTDCAATGAVCTEDGTMLSGAVSATVPHTYVGPSAATAPLRASFANVPAEHDGGTVFTFEVRFSEAFRLSYVTMRDDVLRVTNGRVTRAQRLDNPHHEHEGMQPNRTWKISVSPDAASEDVTIVLPATTSCDASGAVCTGDGRKLSNTESATVAGPPSLSIADAQVDEAAGATLEFTVSLSRAASETVTVDWATADGTATAGSDYTADSGTLTFAPDETSKTVAVAVLDDSHDEGNETLTVTLSNPSGAYLADSEATGTIENTDHMPQAWLSRFGRTVAEQVLDAVEERIRSAPQAGVQVTVAGQRIGAAQAPDADALEEAEAQARLEDFSTWLRGEACRDDPGAGGDCPARTRSREVTPRDLLTGSSFALTTGAEGIGGGLVSLWGRGAVSSFDGREGELSLSGEVTGAMLGADWTRERWTTGLMLSHARGEGSYRGADSGKVSSTVTGLYPYGRYAVTDRVTVWGAAGYGVGTLTLTPDGQLTYEADMDLAMAAAGLRGTVVEAPPEGGPELAVKTDAMAVRTSSEATEDSAGGKLAAATADVTRLRLGLEGTWRGLEIGTGTLVPRLEIGVRHDGGDAETGFGLDLGGGLAWSDPGTGLRAEVSGRGLLTHESAGFRERGIAGSFGWDPTPGSDRGPSLTLSQTMGVSARGGADALLGRTTLAGLAANDNGDELERRRMELKLGYGFGAFGDRFTSTPEVGFGMSEGHRDYSLAWRFVRDRRRGDIGSLEFSLETRRRESANDDTPPEHTVGLRLTARF